MKTKELEKKTKLSWLEKRKVKKFIKQSKKEFEKVYKSAVDKKTDRDKLEKEVLDLLEVVNVELDNGEQLNKENIKETKEDELLEIFEKSLDEMEKLL